ncbi:MAG: glucose-6-phosphate dehydrogenase, partial [Phocaeicola sp.]|nr:glucose-6-phosphate dehydrogenase [Phocaeicola sp.]
MHSPYDLFLIIFGASGDLTRRKLMPALIKIYGKSSSAGSFIIIGCARTPYTD